MSTTADNKLSPIIDPEAVQIPVFSCTSLEKTLRFYRSLEVEITHEQTSPYVYGAIQWGSTSIHFHGDRKMNPEKSSSCLIMVDDVETPYRIFIENLRKTYNGLPVSGLPKITRFRKGHTRFTMYDPDGNTIQFISKSESEYNYESNAAEGEENTFGRTLSGISNNQSALMKAFETAVFLRDTYHNDKAASKKLDRAIEHCKSSAPIELARAMAARAELAVALDDPKTADDFLKKLGQIDLTKNEKELFEDELKAALELKKLIAPYNRNE